MKMTFRKAETITAQQAMLAASNFSADWRAKKYHRARIKKYGELDRAALKELGARITKVKNN